MMSLIERGRAYCAAAAILLFLAVPARAVDLQPPVGAPLAGLSPSELDRFFAGRERYIESVQVFEGVGPNLNGFSCVICHSNPVGGQSVDVVFHFGNLSPDGTFDPLEELGGTQLQVTSIAPCSESIPREANITFLRATPGALGFGLIEAIPDESLIAVELSPPSRHVSGREHMVQALEDERFDPLRVGRFGWKSQLPTIRSFSADAARNELGLTNQLIPTEPPPNGDVDALIGCDSVLDPEDNVLLGGGVTFVDRVTDFQRMLAAPPQSPKSGMAGEAIFIDIGCADCHMPAFVTADDPSLEDAIRNRRIQPYSDFLLHDMGDLQDFPQGNASAGEFRTTPLWGLRRRTSFMHDGSVQLLPFEDMMHIVIDLHDSPDSEAAHAAQSFSALSSSEQSAVVLFLDSLGRREFDMNGDDDVDFEDFLLLEPCLDAPTVTPDDLCTVSDIDQDGDVDAEDFAYFLQVYDGPEDDCNDNGQLDLTDIVTGDSADLNGNGIPDECEPCPPDLDDSGDVGFADLLVLLDNWGPCPIAATCPGNLDGDSEVGFGDLLVLLAQWGACIQPA